MRPFLLPLPMLLAGCISFSSTSETPAAPDYRAFCKEKETQCQCKKPGAAL